MQEIQLWMYKCSTIYIYTAFSYVHAWVFQIDTYKCLTCMHVSISYVCVYDTEVYMYVCVCVCFSASDKQWPDETDGPQQEQVSRSS